MDKKYLLGVAVAAALGSGSAIAGPSVNFYGEVDASVAHTDVDPGTGTSINMESFQTHIGITGGDKLNENVRAFYRAEFGFQMSEGSASFDGGTFGGLADNHERYIGLACNTFGKVRLGQIDSIYDDAVDAPDVFQSVHAVNQYATGTRREVSDNTVRWDSNELLKGLSVSASVQVNGTSGDEEVDTYSFGANYEVGGMKFHYAHENQRNSDASGDTTHKNGVGVNLDLGPIGFGANFERFSGAGTANGNAGFVSATFAASDKLDIALGLGRENPSEGADDDDKDTYVVAAHYNMSNKTVAYAELAGESAATGPDSALNKRWFNVGVRHSFGNPRR